MNAYAYGLPSANVHFPKLEACWYTIEVVAWASSNFDYNLLTYSGQSPVHFYDKNSKDVSTELSPECVDCQKAESSGGKKAPKLPTPEPVVEEKEKEGLAEFMDGNDPCKMN